jgi:UDP-N-acetylglucosamine 4,6-dehydratase/5-epimerase
MDIKTSLVSGKLLIFGGAGSLGHALVEYYRNHTEEIVVVSRDEAKHWDLKNKFGTKYSVQYRSQEHPYTKTHVSTLRTVVGDVRDARRMSQIIRDENPSHIIIAQAMKQVDTCEEQPSEAIETNVIGVRNILDAVKENEIRPDNEISDVCFVSTDKAASPINIYGMCKSISEKMVVAMSKRSNINFVVTRYGNVVSSKGSIIPLFQQQAKDKLCFTVTVPEMTRFMMLLEESVLLIDAAMNSGASGTIWIPKLDSFRVGDMARYFSEKYSKPIDIVGIRPGEKIHEILFSETEDLNTKPTYNGYILIDTNHMPKNPSPKDYSSRDYAISYEELSSRLDQFLAKGRYVKNFRANPSE